MKKEIYLFAILSALITSCFAPGSYPYAEKYKFNSSETILIKAVNEFKKENPKYYVPYHISFLDGRNNNHDHWYHVWFYYSEDNLLVKCWIQNNVIALVGIGEGFGLYNYKEINNEFTRKENKKQKKKFERLILNEIKKKVEEIKDNEKK